MTEAAVIRYLTSKGWKIVEDGWFGLEGVYETVCLETAFHLQKRMEMAAV